MYKIHKVYFIFVILLLGILLLGILLLGKLTFKIPDIGSTWYKRQNLAVPSRPLYRGSTVQLTPVLRVEYCYGRCIEKPASGWIKISWCFCYKVRTVRCSWDNDEIGSSRVSCRMGRIVRNVKVGGIYYQVVAGMPT